MIGQMSKKEPQIERVGEILQKSLKRLDPSGTLLDYGVWPIWNETVGAAIARNAQPDRIRHGTLFVKVTSSTWMQQLQYMKDMIAEKLNQRLGKEVVKNIFFVVGKVEAQKLKSKSRDPAPNRSPAEALIDPAELDSIRDPEIRQALKRLFNARTRKSKN
jgi:predicted nucleic acid-binding Zn ribbon protein